MQTAFTGSMNFDDVQNTFGGNFCNLALLLTTVISDTTADDDRQFQQYTKMTGSQIFL